MKSQVIPRAIDFNIKYFYRILFDDDHIPVEIPKDQADEVLSNFLSHLEQLKDDIENMYYCDYEIYRLLFRETYNSFEIDDGKSWRLNNNIDTVKEVIEKLKTQNNFVKSIENSITLSDLGFRNTYIGDKSYYEKLIEDTNEKEIIEEIILLDKPLYRKRTITWKITPGCKSSDTITYEDLEITDEIKKAIKNQEVV